MRRVRKNRKAFTLIEVLLVAGILAVLAAFAIPSLMEKAQEAKMELAKAAIGPNGPIAKALENYKWDLGVYPDTDEGIDALLQSKDEASDDRYKGPYLQNDEITDPWSNPYEYKSPGDVHEERYDLWSTGPDGQNDDGKEGSDDIKNWIEK